MLSLEVVSRNVTNKAVTFVSPDSKSMHLCFDALKTDGNDLPDVPSSPEHSSDSDATINNFILGEGYTNFLENEIRNLLSTNSHLKSELAGARREIAVLTTNLHSYPPSSPHKPRGRRRGSGEMGRDISDLYT